MLSPLRWYRTRRRLRRASFVRVPLLLILVALVLSITFENVDELLMSVDEDAADAVDRGAAATMLSVVAGGMITLAGLVFTALTVAMQFGSSTTSMRIVPMLREMRIMRWSVGMFLATFVFALVIALDLSFSDDGDTISPLVSSAVVFALVIVSTVLFVGLIARVTWLLDSSQLLHWLGAAAATAIRASYQESAEEPAPGPAAIAPPGCDGPAHVIRHAPKRSDAGRILLAADRARIRRLSARWGTRIELVPRIGDSVSAGAPLLRTGGALRHHQVRRLRRAVVFGDTQRPASSPAAALQAMVDIALKALSPATNDPGRAVQALDRIEETLLLLSPRVCEATAHRMTWNDFVAMATDEIRHYSTGSVQVQRRLRGLFTTLLDACPPHQHPPLRARLRALDAGIARQWPDRLDRRLASVPDAQGFGSAEGFGSAGE